jgi:hypothetical protein
MRRVLPGLVGSVLAWTVATAAVAADASGPPVSGGRHHVATHPSWHELTADQREALAPLAGDWDKFEAERKRKWIEIAAKYRNMSPEGQQRLQQRMPQLARLTAEQRETARENFRRAYSLPPDQRQALTQKYQSLPDERKRELAAQSQPKHPKPALPRPSATPPHQPGATATDH